MGQKGLSSKIEACFGFCVLPSLGSGLAPLPLLQLKSQAIVIGKGSAPQMRLA